MDRIAFIDLDDTIIVGNSTYDFIKWYLRHRYGFPGYMREKVAVIIIRIMSQLTKNSSFLRRIYLLLTLFGEPYSAILYYATLWIKSLVKVKAINVKVINIIEKLRSKGYNLVLLTAGIDPITDVIRRILTINSSLSTKLKIHKGIVIGIEADLYGYLKFKAALRKFHKSIINAVYIADEWSIKNENAHLFVKEVIIVK